MYTPIDANDMDYKGTVNNLPHPVLVLKENQLEKKQLPNRSDQFHWMYCQTDIRCGL